jgi:predicted ATP-grasp superfamily ATP-dependent carboligase
VSAEVVMPTARSHPLARTGRRLDVLLLEGHYRQSLACMRTYGRLGLRVGAVICESAVRDASNLRSRWCSLSAVVPDFEHQAEEFATALLTLLDEHPVGMLLPAHDGSIAAVRARRAAFERRTVLPLASEAALAVAESKARTLALAEALGIAVPRTVPVNGLADVPEALGYLSCPVVIKPVHSWIERGGTGTRLHCAVASTVDEAKSALNHVLATGGRAVLQEWLPGRREALSLFYARNRIWARFAQVSYREYPPLGGVSVLCESIPLLPGITEAAERLVRAMDLEGCSMVEFRRDREGNPVLMEVNPRMAGSVALAISAGVNFPHLLYAWAMGEPLQEVSGYRVGRRLRWVEADLWNLKWALTGPGQPDVLPPARALTTFLSDFVLRPSAFNVVDIRDFRPELAQVRRLLRLTGRGARRLALSYRQARKG